MKRTSLILLIFAFLGVLIVGCGSNGKKEGSGQNGGASAAVSPTAAAASPTYKVQKIVVGTTSVFPNVSFIDANGKLTGFDVELVKELDKRLPQYEFEIQPLEFSSLLLSLETKKIDFIAQIMNKNPEREAKFLFTKEPYSYFKTKVAVEVGNDQIHSLDDLRGKKLYIGSSTSNNAYFIEEYNKKQDKKVEVVYGNGGANDLVNLLRTKRVDATLQNDFSYHFEKDADGKEALKLVGDPLFENGVYYVLRKDSQELSDKLDEAIKAVKADGTLSKLSIQWLGQDYTKSLKE
ncbi:L-cystine transport system substrate-binding protein [Paenibacillus forsythiae]|uniref:L-cystine transport system substrate-binding protein n=1 Tax=Paenibacillus forsythiae TaxID=365616 RepID=A0ABU3H4Z8_9BACL|nr:transporter substrate-binding domain-containing protein [Paenibacillus forsythiae]MDT3425888.1 L-cystine transport system substrate-binding protein [Paenibacillus forsythiae]